jgi:hypothetical protein
MTKAVPMANPRRYKHFTPDQLHEYHVDDHTLDEILTSKYFWPMRQRFIKDDYIYITDAERRGVIVQVMDINLNHQTVELEVLKMVDRVAVGLPGEELGIVFKGPMKGRFFCIQHIPSKEILETGFRYKEDAENRLKDMRAELVAQKTAQLAEKKKPVPVEGVSEDQLKPQLEDA